MFTAKNVFYFFPKIRYYNYNTVKCYRCGDRLLIGNNA